MTTTTTRSTAARYRVHLPRHGTVRYCVTLREATSLYRGEVRDGWGNTHVVRLRDGQTVLPKQEEPR